MLCKIYDYDIFIQCTFIIINFKFRFVCARIKKLNLSPIIFVAC